MRWREYVAVVFSSIDELVLVLLVLYVLYHVLT